MDSLEDYIGLYHKNEDKEEFFHIVQASSDDDLDAFHVFGMEIGDDLFWRVSRRRSYLQVTDFNGHSLYTSPLSGSDADHVAAMTPPDLARHAWRLADEALRSFLSETPDQRLERLFGHERELDRLHWQESAQ
jgi:hypothetical protein